MENFILKDELCHKAYNFPKTLLVFGKSGVMPDCGRDELLMDGAPIAYDAEKGENGGWRLKLLADLPCGGKHCFTWKRGENKFGDLGNDNGKIRIKNVRGGLFDVILRSGERFSYRLKKSPVIDRETVDAVTGKTETVFTKTLIFQGGATYRFTLKLKRELDYIEIYETASGFRRGECALALTKENFHPDYRYTKERGEEKIDAYLGANGKFPFVVKPFAPRTSWWSARGYAELDKKSGLWSGILLHDLKNFDDGEYALWESSDTLAFSVYEDRLEGAVENGKRAFMHILCRDKSPEALYSHYLRYYGLASLNKVKDYVLSWEDDRNEYPKYFRVQNSTVWGGFYGEHTGKPKPEDMMNILDRDATMIIQPEDVAPVSCRAYRTSWAQTFDLTARELSSEQFARVRAMMALICYTFADENYYPVENMLAGHPNFLTDVLGTVAVFASLLGKRHPMHDRWLSYYEIAVARNLKYHVRPDVRPWGAIGGRWTENVGAYMMCMLQCVVYDCHIVYRLNHGEMPLLYPHAESFFRFLVNIRLPENESGRRLYSPHGAHSCTGSYGGKFGHGYMLAMIELADMLQDYRPLYAEYLLHNFRNQSDFESVLSSSGIYGETYRRLTENRSGTSPELYSCKYTGFGFLLRDHANTDGEAEVFLQQIDEGPNYRWGRAAQGGCGELYYYAGRKKYTDLSPEAVGDENRGDVQSCTNFGVLIGHEYRSVGRNDLTEPLMNFGFVRYARVNAGKYSAPYYKYRSVIFTENRYVAVYDAVADMRQSGRFAWSQNSGDEFPFIKNVRPGVEGVLSGEGVPVDADENYHPKYASGKILSFTGRGDFLTVISHLRTYHDERPLYAVNKAEYGADVVFAQYTDRIFSDEAHIVVDREEFAFNGYAGLISDVADKKRLAIFCGKMIRSGDFSVELPFDKKIRRGIGAEYCNGSVCGKAYFEEAGRVTFRDKRFLEKSVFIDGEKAEFEKSENEIFFTMPKGEHTYNIGVAAKIGRVKILNTVRKSDGFKVVWEALPGADSYEIALSSDGEYTFETAGVVSRKDGACAFVQTKLKEGKYFVRVRGKNETGYGEYSPSYPVYVSAELPHAPSGFRIEKTDDGYSASWGEVLGCAVYRLYRQENGGARKVYEGAKNKCCVQEGKYYATAIDGNGESVPSLSRSSVDLTARWDHHPEKKFIRDTRSHEYGYDGFDYVGNGKLPVLEYPEEK